MPEIRQTSLKYVDVPHNSDLWPVLLKAEEVQGKKGWKSTGMLLLNDVQMEDGIIEFDFMGTDSMGAFTEGSSVEVVFRADSENDYEKIYCRLHDSGLQEAVQYMPIIGQTGPWRLYKQEQANVVFLDGWNHLKLILQGSQAQLFINDTVKPVLTIAHLRNETKKGMIGVKSISKGIYFANFRYAKLPVSMRTKAHGSLPKAVARKWEVIPRRYIELKKPLEQFAWPKRKGEVVETEVDGMLNLIRYRAQFNANLAFNTAASRLIIDSEEKTERILRFGFYKRVQIFLNGKSLLWKELPSRDDNIAAAQGNTDGWVRLSRTDEVTLPLRKGKNELIFLSEGEGYGIYVNWGLFAQLVDMNGLEWCGID
jgi:hypothetical protein